MSRIYYEIAASYLTKRKEELCGDSVVYSRLTDAITLVHSDGLGSGVKANILATLTTSIASRLLNDGLPIDTVVETLSETLPVCKVRKIAYSTFTVAKFLSSGDAHVFSFDTPEIFVFRKNKLRETSFEPVPLHGRAIKEARFNLRNGDWIVSVSDGVINAGIGAAYALGWGWENVAEYVSNRLNPKRSAQSVADDVVLTTLKLYEGKPGDDVSVAVVKARYKRVATVFTGPPANREDDARVIEKLLSTRGSRIVCGGTTATLVAKALNTQPEVNLSTARPDIPPSGSIQGIDLATEGILTLTATLKLLRDGTSKADVQYRVDGAAALLREFHYADEITFLVGRAVNPSHQNPNMPASLVLKTRVVNEIAALLRKNDKEVNIELY